MNVINQTRVSGTDDWLLQEYSRSDQSFSVLDQGELSLSDIYRKITFEE